VKRRGSLLLLLVVSVACVSTRGAGDSASLRPVPPDALLAGNAQAALGAWYLEVGRNLEQGCRELDAGAGGDPRALLGAFVCADLRVDETRLVEIGERLLGGDDLHRWPAATQGYVLVRLGRSPLAGALAERRHRVLESAYRTGGLPLEVYGLEHQVKPRDGAFSVVGPFPGPSLAAFDRALPVDETGLRRLQWSDGVPFPTWLEPGRYRLRFAPTLDAGTAVLAVVRSRNPVKLLGLAEGPLDVNPPGEAALPVRYLTAHGAGSPLEVQLALATPDADFGVTLLPLPGRAQPLSCGAEGSSPGPFDDWACAWLALASGRLELAERVLARHPGPTYRVLLAGVRLQRAPNDEAARREALLGLTSALEEMPGLALAHLVLARAHDLSLDLRRALADLDLGEARGAASPLWGVARAAAWERASMPAEAARARSRLAERWPALTPQADWNLPWEPPATPPIASLPPEEQVQRGVPSSVLGADLVREQRLERLPATLRALDTADAHELLAVLGERTFWDPLRTPLDELLGASRDEPPSEAPGTVLVQEAIATGRFLYLHRAVRIDTVEGVRRFGEFSPDGAPLVLRVRAIKPDHSVVFPETHGASPVHAFPDLEPGDVIELEWVEDLVPGGGPAAAFRTVSLQDRELRVARCCFTVLGPAAARPGVEVESGPLWMFEKGGNLADGTAYSQWCTRRVPPLVTEPDAFQPDAARTHVAIYPWADEGEALGRVHDDLWRVARVGGALQRAAADLAARHAGDPEGLVRAALAAVGERIEPLTEAYAMRPADEAWSTRRGNPALVLLAMLRAAGRPARLVLVNPLELERPSAARFSSQDFPIPVVAVDIGRGRVVWLDPGTRPTPWDWLPARLLGRPAWSFGFPGAPFRLTTPETTSETDLLRVDLACERTCKVTVSATGGHRVWLERELSSYADGEARATWFATLVSEVVPVADHAERVRVDLRPDSARVEGRVTLAPGPDGTLRVEPLLYAEALLRRYGGPAARRYPILVDSDLAVEISARFDDWHAVDLPPLDERNAFFSCHAALARDDDGVTWTSGFRVRPQIVDADVYAGFRQDLQRVSRPVPVQLSR